jgi:O-antigen/teichoic acid export membrane protein
MDALDRPSAGRTGGDTARRGSSPRRHPALSGLFLASHLLVLNALGLFSTAYIIRRLGPLHYGEWATAAALAAAHLIVTNVGLRPLFVREVARRPEHAATLLAEQLGLRLVLGVAACGSAMTVCVLLRYPPAVTACTLVGCVWILLSVVSTTFGDVLHGLEQFGGFAATGFASGLAVTAVTVIAVHLGCGPVGLSLAYLTAPIVNVWLYGRLTSQHLRIGVRWDRVGAVMLLRASRLSGVAQLATAARDRTEPLLVPKLAGLESFGIFNAGSMVADRLGYVPDAICTVFYPRISRAAQVFAPSAEPIVAQMMTMALAASMPLAIVGTYLAQPIAGILLPASSETCRLVIQISVWAVPALAISHGLTFALQAAGGHDRVARLGLQSTLASATLAVVLIAAFGIPGASWSLPARPAIVTLALWPAFRRSFPGVLSAVPWIRIVLSLAALASVCLATNPQGIGGAFACAACGVVAYVVALFASRVLSISAIARVVALESRRSPAITHEASTT